MASPENAYEAFKQGKTYRPRTWGIGVNAMKPRENGVEAYGGVYQDGVEIGPPRELILFHYHTPTYGTCRKWAIARKPCPPEGVADPFRTGYDWVEVPKKEVA